MARGKREKREVPAWLLWLWFPAVLTVQELAVHLYAFGAEGRFGYPILFSLAFGGMADLLCALCSGPGCVWRGPGSISWSSSIMRSCF